MKIKYVYLTVLSLIAGCSNVSSPLYSPHGGSEKGMPIHGNFCGPNIPTVNITTHAATIKELLKIPATDSIDKACKAHDICYVSKNKKHCDNVLISDISKLSGTVKGGCYTLTRLIQQPFSTRRLKNTSKIMKDVSKDPTSAITLPLGVLMDAYETAFTIAGASIDTLYSPLTITISEDGEKRLLSPIPDRYFNCDE